MRGNKNTVTIFPARAGMSPQTGRGGKAVNDFPRASGDEPWDKAWGALGDIFSPRERG